MSIYKVLYLPGSGVAAPVSNILPGIRERHDHGDGDARQPFFPTQIVGIFFVFHGCAAPSVSVTVSRLSYHNPPENATAQKALPLTRERVMCLLWIIVAAVVYVAPFQAVCAFGKAFPQAVFLD